MDEKFRRYYNNELQYLRGLGGEFAEQFPKIAGRLGLSATECADPYVERLLEGFAFLSARVRLETDSQFPRITRHLLDSVFPGYLNPFPSMLVAEMHPDPAESSLVEGVPVPRDSALLSLLGKGEQTRCEFRTAHDVTLWPIEVREVKYLPNRAALAAANVNAPANARAGVSLKLGGLGGVAFDELSIDRLPVYLKGAGDLRGILYEQIVGHGIGYAARSASSKANWSVTRGPESIRQYGFDPDQALLPTDGLSFDPYRLIQEYFAFPDRFFFFELTDLGEAAGKCAGSELDIVIFFELPRDELVDVLEPANFRLFCTPAINLFPRRLDRIHLNDRDFEFHIVADRTRPMDFEIWQVESARGFGTSNDEVTAFKPFYSAVDQSVDAVPAYFVVNREPRRYSSKQKLSGSRSKYLGTECYISLVDAREAPYSSQLKQLEIKALCTNRDLPLLMAIGQGVTDFDLQQGAPVDHIRCIAGPSRPRHVYEDGDVAWRLINTLSVNYLSLIDDSESSPSALRDMLKLFCDQNDIGALHQIDAVTRVQARPMTARLPSPGLVTFGRGLNIQLELDEAGFEGLGGFLLSSVMDHFFSRYVSVNSFCRTSYHSIQRGEIVKWPIRAGQRVIL